MLLNVWVRTLLDEAYAEARALYKTSKSKVRGRCCCHAKDDSVYSKCTGQVEEYGRTGMGFDELVETYTQLRNQISNKKWTLEQMEA